MSRNPCETRQAEVSSRNFEVPARREDLERSREELQCSSHASHHERGKSIAPCTAVHIKHVVTFSRAWSRSDLWCAGWPRIVRHAAPSARSRPIVANKRQLKWCQTKGRPHCSSNRLERHLRVWHIHRVPARERRTATPEKLKALEKNIRARRRAESLFGACPCAAKPPARCPSARLQGFALTGACARWGPLFLLT